MKGDRYDFKKLATLREAKFTQEEFAKLLEIHVITLSRVENGRSASYDLVFRICQQLGIDSSKIFYPSRKISALLSIAG